MRKTVAVCIPPDVLFNVDRYCREACISRSDLITRALGVYWVANANGKVDQPPPTKQPTTLTARIARRLEALGGRAKQWDLVRPLVATSTAEQREAVLASFERVGMIRRTRVQPPMGRPYVLVEAVPDGMHIDEMPPPPPDHGSTEAVMERVLAWVAQHGGRVLLARVSARFARVGSARLRAALDGLVARGLLARETEAPGARPGRPRTWVVLVGAKAPVGPVAASDAPGGGGVAEAPGTPHAGNGGVLDGGAPAGAGDVVR